MLAPGESHGNGIMSLVPAAVLQGVPTIDAGFRED